MSIYLQSLPSIHNSTFRLVAPFFTGNTIQRFSALKIVSNGAGFGCEVFSCWASDLVEISKRQATQGTMNFIIWC
jgi:hypothetical protein